MTLREAYETEPGLWIGMTALLFAVLAVGSVAA